MRKWFLCYVYPSPLHFKLCACDECYTSYYIVTTRNRPDILNVIVVLRLRNQTSKKVQVPAEPRPSSCLIWSARRCSFTAFCCAAANSCHQQPCKNTTNTPSDRYFYKPQTELPIRIWAENNPRKGMFSAGDAPVLLSGVNVTFFSFRATTVMRMRTIQKGFRWSFKELYLTLNGY